MNTLGDHAGRAAWATPIGTVVTLWVLAVAAVGWLAGIIATGADPAGSLIAGIAALGLTLAAVSGTRARPRLDAGPEGLTIRRLIRTRHTPWSRVDDVRILRTRRLGRESSLLELDLRDVDGAERLVILGRAELGTDPEDVAEILADLRPAHEA